MKTMRSNGRITDKDAFKLKNAIVRLGKQIERLKLEKGDLEFELGRVSTGKKMHKECRSKSPDKMCPDCNCWKLTREICS